MVLAELVDPKLGLVVCPRLPSLAPILEFCAKMGYSSGEIDLVMEGVISVASVDDMPEMQFATFEDVCQGLCQDESLFPAAGNIPGLVIDDFRNKFFNVCREYSDFLSYMTDPVSFDNGYLALMYHSLQPGCMLLSFDKEFYADPG